jgi:signal transduction histidine kinase
MLSYSPQGTFILTLFALVMSGLCLAVLLWVRMREPAHAAATGLRALAVGLGLLLGAFAVQALYDRLAMRPADGGESATAWLLVASDGARLLAAGALVAGYLVLSGRPRRAWMVVILTLALAGIGIPRLPEDMARIGESIVPLTMPRAGEVSVLLFGVILLGRSSSRPATAALCLLGAGRGVAWLAAGWPAASEAFWAAEQLATLAALVLLALSLERESSEASLRSFVRLNLTILVLATSLILVVTELGRRQFVALAALHVEDVAEFVRGHTLQYFDQGEAPEAVLSHEDVLRRVVADFGRYPDLRRVQVTLEGHSMALVIHPSREVEQEFWMGHRLAAPRVSPADFAMAPVVHMPLRTGGRAVGSVQLEQSLERINEKVGWQMQVIFAVFTLFVGMASVVTGLLIVGAERTIRSQYGELQRAERRLSQAERLASIGAVADGVAHELNNPAGILVARTDYLLSVIESSLIPSDVRDDLDTIRRQAQRIGKTVKGLLSFTRPTPLQSGPVNVRAVLESAAASSFTSPPRRRRSVATGIASSRCS